MQMRFLANPGGNMGVVPCGDTEFVTAASLLEDKRAGETPETQESEFSWSADDIVGAQHDPDIQTAEIYTHGDPRSPYQRSICY